MQQIVGEWSQLARKTSGKETVQDMPMPGDCVVELRVPDKPVTFGLLITDAMLDIGCQRHS